MVEEGRNELGAWRRKSCGESPPFQSQMMKMIFFFVGADCSDPPRGVCLFVCLVSLDERARNRESEREREREREAEMKKTKADKEEKEIEQLFFILFNMSTKRR